MIWARWGRKGAWTKHFALKLQNFSIRITKLNLTGTRATFALHANSFISYMTSQERIHIGSISSNDSSSMHQVEAEQGNQLHWQQKNGKSFAVDKGSSRWTWLWIQGHHWQTYLRHFISTSLDHMALLSCQLAINLVQHCTWMMKRLSRNAQIK